jgi:hypothetical protein
MRTFDKNGSGRVWKLLFSYRDLEINDIVSLHYGPGKTKRDLYKVKEIENSVITLTTAYNVDVELDIEVYGSSFLHILNPDIKEEWVNNFNKKAILNF